MRKLIHTIQTHYLLILAVFVTGLLAGWLLFRNSGSGEPGHTGTGTASVHDHGEEEEATWTCSMHPQIRQDGPGQCPICGMDLVPLQSLSGGSAGSDPDGVQMSEAALRLAEVETITVSRGRPEGTFFLQGKIEPDERKDAELTARFGGRIEELLVNFTGQQVELGEPLATLYSPELVAAQRELLEAARFRESRPALYEAARTRLKLWDLTDDQIDDIEAKGEPDHYFEVRSPIRGTILKRHVSRGDYIREGSPLFRVTDLSSVWAMLDAYESDIPWIGRGDMVDMTIPAVPGRTFSGRVAFIDPFIDPQARVARVRIELNNPGELLKPEMLVNGVVRSSSAAQSDALLVPASAVLWTGKRSVVYVNGGGSDAPSFTYREIVLGPRAGDHYVVEEGLQEGEEIAVNGVFRIDAAAQLEGKRSMMSSTGAGAPPAHVHGGTATGGNAPGAAEGHEHPVTSGENALLHTSFRVGGNCGMCKDRIEQAAMSVDGVTDATWETESGILHLNILPEVPVERVHLAVAASGHDTELKRAPDTVYGELPECCLYERFEYE